MMMIPSDYLNTVVDDAYNKVDIIGEQLIDNDFDSTYISTDVSKEIFEDGVTISLHIFKEGDD